MAEEHALSILRKKRDDIRDMIAAYEKQIAIAKRDLVHVNATIQLFEVNGETPQFPVHMGLHRLFARGELLALCLEALKAAPDGLDTRELALAVVRAKGMDEGDRVLRASVGYKVVTIMPRQARKGVVVDCGRRKGVKLWRLGKAVDSRGHSLSQPESAP